MQYFLSVCPEFRVQGGLNTNWRAEQSGQQRG